MWRSVTGGSGGNTNGLSASFTQVMAAIAEVW